VAAADSPATSGCAPDAGPCIAAPAAHAATTVRDGLIQISGGSAAGAFLAAAFVLKMIRPGAKSHSRLTVGAALSCSLAAMVARAITQEQTIMTTHIGTSTINKPPGAPGPAVDIEHDPTPLAMTDLDHVVAAGSKPGLTGGSGAGAPSHRSE
jgi:hypothetical protein